MSNDAKALGVVADVLEASTEGLFLHQVVDKSGLLEDTVKHCLRSLAGQGRVEMIPTRGRWGNRYAAITSTKPVTPAAITAEGAAKAVAALGENLRRCVEAGLAPTIVDTLEERGQRYGKFTTHAAITQSLKQVMYSHEGWGRLADDQKESLEMVAHKIGRILNGDPDYDDSWVDIAGYTTLVADRLRGVER